MALNVQLNSHTVLSNHQKMSAKEKACAHVYTDI